MKSILRYIIAFAVSLLIFVGLPFFGWGFRHFSSFFENPARIGFLVVIVALQLFAVSYNPQVGRNQENRKSDVEQHKLDLVLVQVFSLAIVILAPFSDQRSFMTFDIGNITRYIGLILIVPGFVLMQMAEKYLDKQFSIEVTLQKDHKLIQSGPYKFIRHPRYLGILSFFLGISLTFRSLLGILLTLALTGVLVWRVFKEDALMKQEFGSEWEIYTKKSWRIIPFIF